MSGEPPAIQNANPFAFELLPMPELRSIAEVRRRGAEKWGKPSWLEIPLSDSVGHAFAHLSAAADWLGLDGEAPAEGKSGEAYEELIHAALRCVLAAATLRRAVPSATAARSELKEKS